MRVIVLRLPSIYSPYTSISPLLLNCDILGVELENMGKRKVYQNC